MFSYACYTLGSREEAEDVTQDVFIRLWDHWHELDHESITGWIIRVARNACLDKLRQRQSRSALLNEHYREFDRHAEPENLVDDDCKELKRRIEAAIQELEEPYRSIVILREIDELAYDEIAKALVMPLNTVKVYLHRARKLLRAKLKDVYESA